MRRIMIYRTDPYLPRQVDAETLPMLKEIEQARQVPGEPTRRWFADDSFHLIVWSSQHSGISAFQLCYCDGTERKALTWKQEGGFSNKRIDDGEDVSRGCKMAPILVPDGPFQKERVLMQFLDRCPGIDSAVAAFVSRKIRDYTTVRRRKPGD